MNESSGFIGQLRTQSCKYFNIKKNTEMKIK